MKLEHMDGLVKKMPAVLAEAYDPLQHKTPADLAFLSQHTLDMADEGEWYLTPGQRKQVSAYQDLCKATQ
jgi:hypothetical protein